MTPDAYSASYAQARQRFLDGANRIDARQAAYELDVAGHDGEKLTIDVAMIGDPQAKRVLMVSSGMHGVEGFFGSAVQTGWLAALRDGISLRADTAVVLIHAVNPYGFSWRRRVNEDNIDLNRNFLRSDQTYAGAPPGYAELDAFLNPKTAPSSGEPYRLKALWHIARLGLPALKRAVAVGQYDFPEGLFFGGRGPSQSTRIIRMHCSGWVGSATDIVHVDLHTGLGDSGRYKLLVRESPESPEMDWYRSHFGSEVESTASSDGTAYPAAGMIGSWLAEHWRDRRYHYLAAEFGTFPVVRVLGAMRAENRAHFHASPGQRPYERAKTEMLECFCPRDPSWRSTVLDEGLEILRCGLGAVSSE